MFILSKNNRNFQRKKIPKITWYNDITGEKFEDSEDVIGELAKIISISEKKDDNNNNNNIASSIGPSSPKKNNKDDDDSIMGSPSKSESNKSFSDEKDEKEELKNNENKITYENLWDLNFGIDDLICQSLMSVSNKDLRKKLANSIMLVGGTSKLKGFLDFLEDRLINKLSELDNEIERVEIFNYPAIDMKTLSWIGGSILPKLESAKDMWIQKERWLGEPEKLEEQIENNENNKKENNNNGNNIEDKKENENNINNNIDIGSDGEKSKNNDINNEENNSNKDNKENKENKDKDGKEKNKEKKEGDNKKKDDGNKKKKIERHLDGGIILLREKCPFPW